MKSKLTPEQSQRLIELGIDPNKASMCMLYFPESDSSEPLEAWQMWEENGELLCNPDESQVQDVECIIVPKDADYDQSAKEEHPIFNLADVLSLLPKTILLHGDICQLEIKWHGDEWIAKYDDSESDYFHPEHSPELIDALFKLLCWALKNHPESIKQY